MIDSLSLYSEFYDEDMLSSYEYLLKNPYKEALIHSFKNLTEMKIQRNDTDSTIVERFSVNYMLSDYSECEEPLINYVNTRGKIFIDNRNNILETAYHLAHSDYFNRNINYDRYKKLARLKNVHRI